MKQNPRPLVSRFSKLKVQRMADLALRVVPNHLPIGDISLVYEHLNARCRLPAVLHRRTTEVVLCLKGRFAVILGGRRHQLSKGDIVWIPPRTWHVFEAGAGPAEALSIFTPALEWNGKADVVLKKKRSS